MRLRLTLMLPLALVMLFAGCSYSSLASARFTYSVVYSVESSNPASPTTPNVTYLDELGAAVGLAAPPLPWTLELPVMTYDYDNPYYPQLTATAGALDPGETLTVAIRWKDYRTGFTDETLAIQIVDDAGAGATPLDVTLYAPELPLVR